MKLRLMLALMLALSLFAAACGSDDVDEAVGAAQDSADEAMDDADEAMDDADAMADDAMDDMDEAMDDADAMADDAMDDMDDAMDDMDMEDGDHGGMDMGDADATPADEVEGADLLSGEFVLLDTAPDGYEGASGTAHIARTDDGVTVTLRVEGLPADTEHVSHVHEQACEDENGGAHFRYDPDGSELPPNEIHLGFTTDADGDGVMTATNDMVPGDDAMSLIIHPADFPDNRALCANFG